MKANQLFTPSTPRLTFRAAYQGLSNHLAVPRGQRSQNDAVFRPVPKAAVKTNFLSDSEDEFDDWVKKDAPKQKAVISDDESFAPEASNMIGSDVDALSPPPKASKPA